MEYRASEFTERDNNSFTIHLSPVQSIKHLNRRCLPLPSRKVQDAQWLKLDGRRLSQDVRQAHQPVQGCHSCNYSCSPCRLRPLIPPRDQMLCFFSNCAPFSTFEAGEVTKSSTLRLPAWALLLPSAVKELVGEPDYMTITWVQLVPPHASSLPGLGSQASATPRTGLHLTSWWPS